MARIDPEVAKIVLAARPIADGVGPWPRRSAIPMLARRVGSLLIHILAGSFVFLADLIRQLPIRMRIAPLGGYGFDDNGPHRNPAYVAVLERQILDR